MAQTKVGFFTNSTSNATQDITGLGFTPGGVLFWQINSNGADAITWAFGATDFTSQHATGTTGTARESTNNARISATSRTLYRPAVNGSAAVAATASALSDGFRLTYIAQTNALRWGYMAFSDDIDFKVGNFTLGASNASVTGVGFQPSAILFNWLPSNASVTTAAYGFVDENLSEFSFSGNNSTTLIATYNFRTTTSSILTTDTTSVNSRATVSSLDVDGFSYTVQTSGSSQVIGYAAIGRQLKSRRHVYNPGADGGTVSNIPFRPIASLATIYPPDTTYGIAAAMGLTDANGNRFTTATAGYASAEVHNRGSNDDRSIGRTTLGGSNAGLSTSGIITFTDNGFTQSGVGENQDYPILLLGQYTITPKTQTGVARIQQVTSKTQMGAARIQKAITQTTTGKSAIRKEITRTTTGRARIQFSRLRDQTGTASIGPADKVYTWLSTNTLPTSPNDLTAFTVSDYSIVASDDNVYFSKTNPGTYQIVQFRIKNDNNTDNISVNWKGKSATATSVNPVTMEIYNQNTGAWEAWDSDNVTAADVEFVLSGAKTVAAPDYYDAQNWVRVRVYQ